ncbi:MAG: sigma-E factor negative regulatory protein [Betaproteobacteria bacterium]
MSQPEIDRSSSRRILSALADGDATDNESARAFQAWREDDDARSTWHAYQLIGDVLRSEDLATEPAADESFLVALRARLATEPVVLAPQPRVQEAAQGDVAQPIAANATGAVRARARWQGPLAMAAGFLVVIGGLNIVRPFNQGGSAALAQAGASSGAVVAQAAPATASGIVAANAQAKANADQLAPYLAAHRQSTMSGAFQMPGGDLRNVSLVQPAR